MSKKDDSLRSSGVPGAGRSEPDHAEKVFGQLIVLFYSLWQITLLLLYSVSETREQD